MKYTTYLIHYGVEGQKWGVRRYQNEDGTWTQEGLERRKEITDYGGQGGTIKKGTELYRVSIDKNDKTFNNKKYVSTNQIDNARWEDYMVKAYKDMGKDVYAVKYKTLKDIEVAPASEIGKRMLNELQNDPDIINKSINDIRKVFPNLNSKYLSNLDQIGSTSMAAQTDLGNKLINDLLKSGYGAVADPHGWNTSYDPLIILDPDNKIRRTKVTKY